MDTKICNKCKRELPIEQFQLEHTKKYGDRRRDTCRECRANYRKKWRQENPELYHAQATRHQDRQSEWLKEMKTPCIICGESEPVVIDFHHINPEEREFTIGKHRGKKQSLVVSRDK